MSLLGNSEREFIAWPDQTKNQLVFKWPDTNIRLGTQLTIEQDELGVFVRSGQVQGTLGPGLHTLQSSEIPFLANLVDAATGGHFFITELYFVSAREFPNLPFGGMVDNVVDPETQLAVGLRVFGDYSLRVVEPQALILNLGGTQNLGSNDQVTDWVREQLLKVFRQDATRHITMQAWPILGIAAHNAELEQEVLAHVQAQVAPYGLQVTRLGNFTISLKPEDEETLKNYRAQVQYTKLAGGFQQAAAAEALEGIGKGASAGSGAANPAVLGIGLGLAGSVNTPAQQPTTPSAVPAQQAAAAAALHCPNCSAANPPGARFCNSCGTRLSA